MLFAQELSILVTQTYTHSTACSFFSDQQASHLALFKKHVDKRILLSGFFFFLGDGEERGGLRCRQYSPSSKGTNARLVNPAFEEKRQESIQDQETKVDGCKLLGSTRQLNWNKRNKRGSKRDISLMYHPCVILLSTQLDELNAQLMQTYRKGHPPALTTHNITSKHNRVDSVCVEGCAGLFLISLFLIFLCHTQFPFINRVKLQFYIRTFHL